MDNEPNWILVHTEKRPLPPKPGEPDMIQIGPNYFIPAPMKYETLYYWKAEIGGVTKDGKPPKGGLS
jgi:hypothetical protein